MAAGQFGEGLARDACRGLWCNALGAAKVVVVVATEEEAVGRIGERLAFGVCRGNPLVSLRYIIGYVVQIATSCLSYRRSYIAPCVEFWFEVLSSPFIFQSRQKT